MANWLTLELLSKKYGIPESTLRSWKCMGYIVSSTIDNHVVLDEDSLNRLLDAHKTCALGEDYLEKIIKEKEYEREVILSRFDDELFLLRTLEPYQKLFHIIIQELGQFIMDERLREVYLSVSSGEPISRVAKRYEMSFEQVLISYKSILHNLSENTKRIASFCNRPHNSLAYRYNSTDPTNIPLSCILQPNACNILRKGRNICTVRDLLKHTSMYQWNSLMDFHGMGRITYKYVLKSLQEEGFIVVREDGGIEWSPELESWVV